jgi:HK97 family phage major capsid protein
MEAQLLELGKSVKGLQDLINNDVKAAGEKLKAFEAQLAKYGTEAEANAKALVKALADMDAYRKSQLLAKSLRPARPGSVSEACARHLGAVVITAGLRQGKCARQDLRDSLEGVAKDVLGEAEFKTALTSSNIPLPTQYSGELSELVDSFGTARRYGTVYPMGDGTVKLPRGKTYPAFGLLTIATAITEKSPEIEFVQLVASKWGGLIRIPSEINADSIVPLGQFLARYSAREMARLEDTVFWTADGSGTYDSLKGLNLMVSAANNNKLLTMGTGKTTVNDVTLTNLRELRGKCDNAALQGNAAYYLHPSLEAKLCAFNTESKVQVYVPNNSGGATLDGFPVRWINVLPALTNTTAGTIFGLFGDVSYEYLAIRSGMALETSALAGFETDEILVRALERFTIGNMATGAVAGIITAAA